MEVRRDKDKAQQNNRRSMCVGFDLGRYAVQISYIRPGMENPETAELVTGSEVFYIPMVLCKREGVNQWFYGREALKYHHNSGGYLIERLLQKAIAGETEEIEGDRIDSIALLTLFIKRALSVLGASLSSGDITDIMFTCEELGDDVVDVMNRVTAGLNLKKCNIHFQSYGESIYHYLLHQDPELWTNSVLASHYDGTKIVNYVFKRNLRTTPIVAFVEQREAYDCPLPQIITEDAKASAYARLDQQYMDYMRYELRDDVYSSVYLLGDGYKDNWLDKSIGLLCHNRRLFMGNDVFSRGACYALQDKLDPIDVVKEHVYLGPDKLRCNIGLNVMRRGEPSYLALLDAGISWYEVGCEYELFLDEEFKLELKVIPLDGNGHPDIEIELPGPPDRDADTFRVKLVMAMTDVSHVKIHVEDLGFGELYPSSGKTWDFNVEI